MKEKKRVCPAASSSSENKGERDKRYYYDICFFPHWKGGYWKGGYTRNSLLLSSFFAAKETARKLHEGESGFVIIVRREEEMSFLESFRTGICISFSLQREGGITDVDAL